MEVSKLSEEEKKPQKFRLEVTIPTKETFIEGVKKMFPTLEVNVVEETQEEPEQ